jgi:hypothetical protein
MNKFQYPEDNPDHPDHDAAVARAWRGHDKRQHCNLRKMVDSACAGVMPHIEKRIKDAARRAYYLGVLDGIEIVDQQRGDLAELRERLKEEKGK